MYDRTEYENLMAELSKTDQLLQTKEDNVTRMIHFYKMDTDDAIANHIHNIVETYGEEAFSRALKAKEEKDARNKKDSHQIAEEQGY